MDERELIRRLKADEPEAFSELFERCADKVYGVAFRLLRHPQDSEDVMQETFLAVYRGIGNFREESSISTWVYRIAYNQALMKMRKGSLDAVSLDEGLSDGEGNEIRIEMESDGPSPEEQALTSDMMGRLEEALGRMPETLRSVFVLRDVEGYSTAETAAILGTKEATVKTRLYRARRFLREELGE